MKDNLVLRNLKTEYVKINRAKNREIFWDKNRNIVILFCPDSNCDSNSICNCISDDMYDVLIDKLNNSKDIIVIWSQIFGTTSDYTIFEDVDFTGIAISNYRSILTYTRKIISEINEPLFKYDIINNGKLTHILRK